MAMALKELLSAVHTIAPLDLAADWDNCGMQIDLGREEVHKILVALEITSGVIDEAAACGADMILCHHPLLFNPIRTVDLQKVPGRYVIRLIQNGISVYSAHTSFDAAVGGNNDYIAEKAGMEQVENLVMHLPGRDVAAFGRMGVFPETLTLREVGDRLKKALNLSHIRLVGDPETPIKTAAVCTGAGGRQELETALYNRCDLFITGDVRHHEALDALELGICMIDAGHFGTEAIFVENFARKLREMVGGSVEIVESAVNTYPFNTEKY
ncbi:MAG: Nif3-like dinuclear metal center hexameric protein [Firmicutes bacterium]|nr:Nif3-like dinuclear metal center hexameric protein [Bacillota bacterium]